MQNQRLIKFLDVFSYALILLNVALLPLFLDKHLSNFYIIPKQYAFIGILLLNIFAFAAKIVISKKISLKSTVLDLPLVGLLLVSLLSTLFSVNIYESFLGSREFFALSFIFLFFGTIFYFVIVNFVNTPQRWRVIIDLLLGVGGLTSAVFLARALFNFSVPFYGAIWNTVDGTNSGFCLWLIVIFVLAGGLLMKKNLSIGRSAFYTIIMLLALAPLFIAGFKILWVVLLIALVLMLLLGSSFMSEVRVGWLSAIFAILILTVVFVIFGSPKSLQSVLPVEISLGAKPSWDITKSAMFSGVKHFAIGSGLSTFSNDFSKFRSTDFNYDQVAWALRFNQPYNTFFAVVTEGGALMLLGFAFVLLFVMGQVFSTWFKSRGLNQDIALSLRLNKVNIRLDIFLAVIAWLVVFAGMAVNVYGATMWMLWWLLLGLIISGLSLLGHEVIKEKSWTLEDTPQYNLAFSFGLIVVMSLVAMFGVMGVRFYMAEQNYSKAISSSQYESAEAYIQKAIALRKNSDIFHVAVARAYLLKAGELSREAAPNVRAIADFMTKAVQESKLATDLSPNSVAIWENLSTMYENASLIAPEAVGWAIKSLNKSIELEPTNATLYWRLGNSYLATKNYVKAIESYEKAISLKTDYVAAYISLSNAYEMNKELDKAIDTYKKILSVRENDPEVLFNFGRMLFNRNGKDDRTNAEQLWLQAVQLQDKYSNALYSLGLLYEGRGERSKALEYYNKVKDINPENKDVIAKIKALSGSVAGQ